MSAHPAQQKCTAATIHARPRTHAHTYTHRQAARRLRLADAARPAVLGQSLPGARLRLRAAGITDGGGGGGVGGGRCLRGEIQIGGEQV